MSIIFVHGITVREDRFDRLLTDVISGFGQAGSGGAVAGCYWGDLGRHPGYRGASIPGFDPGRRALEEEFSGRERIYPLLLDPLAELVALRDPEEFSTGGLGFMPVPDGVATRNETLLAGLKPVVDLITSASAAFEDPSGPMAPEGIEVVVRVALTEAARADRSLDSAALAEPLTRSILAMLYLEGVGDDVLTSEFKWNVAGEAVEAALNEVFGGQRGMFRLAAATAFTFGLRHGGRNWAMPGLSLFLGDVFAWYRNRDAIIERLETVASRAPDDGDLMLVGHSLGGVIAFDYAQHTNRDIKLLATVGSQVGLFGELGVLPSTEYGAQGKLVTPPRVASWRNIYDPNDALAFLAGPIFERVTDIELNTGAPFPMCHGEYWKISKAYELTLQEP